VQYVAAQNNQQTQISGTNLVTAQSAAYGPPEDGRISGPKHVGVILSLKCF